MTAKLLTLLWKKFVRCIPWQIALPEKKSYEIGRGVAEGATLSSWSNEIVLEFEHSQDIPNVFTPNGDGFNDFFLFRS